MNNRIIAYSIPELEKKMVLSEGKILVESSIITQDQWNKIQLDFATKLYSPSAIMRVLFFIVALFGMLTIMGPIGLLVGGVGEFGYRFLSFLLGVSIILFTDRILIKSKFHYKSGVTEAGIFAGLTFLATAILGFESHNMIVYPLILLPLAALAAIRYLNVTALVLALGFFGWVLFQILSDIGGIAQAIMPFIFMIAYGLIYWSSRKVQPKLSKVIFETPFMVIQTISLIVLYLAGNYFVVRELSIKMLGLTLSENQDIPLAFMFYGFTAIIPITYMYWGLKQKSVMFIRVALLTITLSVITFKYYFSLGKPVVIITVSGAALILLTLLLLNYLKQVRDGYTREKLLNHKWSSPDMMAFIASQTLGGNQISSTPNDEVTFGGGQFGGGGASDKW